MYREALIEICERGDSFVMGIGVCLCVCDGGVAHENFMKTKISTHSAKTKRGRIKQNLTHLLFAI